MKQIRTRNAKTFRITLLAIFSAIIILQNFIPFLGYIPIQPFNPTILHITVIIIAVVMGPLEGSIIGGVWGVVCMVRAFMMPTSPIDPIIFTNPVISLLPRVCIGLVSGYLYRLIRRIGLKDIVSWVVCGCVGSFVNTFLVLGFIYLFYRVPYANFYNMNVSQLLPALLVVVATNGVAEAIASSILVPLIAKPLTVYMDRSGF